MKAKIVSIALIICLALTLSGCSRVHRSYEIKEYIDNLEMNLGARFDYETYPCNLKGRYEIVGDEYGQDKRFGKKSHEILIKLNGTDIVFRVQSELDHKEIGPHKYEIFDDYSDIGFNYLVDEYNKLVGYNNEYTLAWNDGSYGKGLFEVTSQDELDYVTDYIKGLLDYMNGYDYKFLSMYNNYFRIDVTDENAHEESLYVHIDINDNQYFFVFEEEYAPDDNTLETYVANFIDYYNLAI